MPDSPSPDSPLEGDEFLRSVPYVDGRKRLGSVALHTRLGRGAMGAVYRGTHLVLERDVAVKCLILPTEVHAADASRLVRLFRREARIGADLTHENLVRLFELGEEHGVHYLVLEFVDGEDAKSYVMRRGPLPELEAARIVLKVARGLAKAHQHPDTIVHRDIKPANIMISRRGDVKLGDLGLAKAIEQMSAASMLSGLGGVGTSAFMPPEQRRLSASLTPAADIWALGVTLYFFLTQRVPGVGVDEYEWLRALEERGFPDVRELRPDVSPELARILGRCTRYDPRERIQNASALVRELQAYLQQQTPVTPVRAKLAADPQRTSPVRPEVEPAQPVETTLLPLDATNVRDEPRVESGTIASAAEIRRARVAPWVWVAAAAGVLAAAWLLRLAWGDSSSPPQGRVPTGFEPENGQRGEKSEWARSVIHRPSGIVFLLVEPGGFEMGSPDSDPNRDPVLEAQHHVEITKPYYLARSETTRQQYWNVLRVPPSPSDKEAKLPQGNVSWTQADDFCQEIGCALPSEAQWEFAARAGGQGAYAWGDDPEGGRGYCNVLDASAMRGLRNTKDLDQDAFQFDDTKVRASEVEAFHENAWGFKDMHGNYAEWCADVFTESHGALGVNDPLGAGSKGKRPVRGGSYFTGKQKCRVAMRWSLGAEDQNEAIGFRAMRSLP